MAFTMGKTYRLNEALDIFSDHHQEIEQALVDNIGHTINTTFPPRPVSGDSILDEVRQEVRRLQVEETIAPMQRTIKVIQRRRQNYGKVQHHTRITDSDIEQAREYPIEELYTELTGDVPRHGIALCPFHDDTTPSFSMRKYNRYRCFACDAKGDVIDLYMKLAGCNFVQAVKKLK